MAKKVPPTLKNHPFSMEIYDKDSNEEEEMEQNISLPEYNVPENNKNEEGKHLLWHHHL